MKQFTVSQCIYIFIVTLLIACSGDAEKQFEISGIIANNTAKMVYLVELPAGSTQGTIVDSSVIGKDGGYKLKTDSKESLLYSIRLDQNEFPAAYLINDVPKVTVNVELARQNSQFAVQYEVKGSPASREMKDFMATFDKDLQKMYFISREADSLHKMNAPDSSIEPLAAEWRSLAGKARDYALTSFNKANDPALVIFELGYFQAAKGYGLELLDTEEVNEIVNNAAVKFPAHKGLAEIKKSLNDQVAGIEKTREQKWVGKPAPDFSLPDANGKEVKLSSFKGKYVLVDFWASWCKPCRDENPNVVNAYNKFKGKNFTILGVSLDHPGQKDKWLNAIKTDNLGWTQVSDLKGWESVVVPMYDFGQVGIPYNVLVNPEGIVIAERLQGPALEAKLEEVLE